MGYLMRFLYAVELFFYFMKEVVLANLQVAWLVLRNPKDLSPGIIKLPMNLKSEWAQVTLANMITLTPGTLSLNIFPAKGGDDPFILVHVTHFTDAEEVRRAIDEGFTRRLKRVFE